MPSVLTMLALGFAPLPLGFFVALLGMVVGYLGLVELGKRLFYATAAAGAALPGRTDHYRHLRRRTAYFTGPRQPGRGPTGS